MDNMGGLSNTTAVNYLVNFFILSLLLPLFSTELCIFIIGSRNISSFLTAFKKNVLVSIEIFNPIF